ncbi:Acetyltransferase, GNAT [Bacillus cereus Rock3-44]|nr:Acetyltransferase, GNAT [Bacillus cereus Rock3-44]
MGASIGFLPPMEKVDAENYWETVFSPEVILLVSLDPMLEECREGIA